MPRGFPNKTDTLTLESIIMNNKYIDMARECWAEASVSSSEGVVRVSLLDSVRRPARSCSGTSSSCCAPRVPQQDRDADA